MKVPFLDLKAQYHQIKNEVDAAIREVIANTSFVMGPYLQSFEQALPSTWESNTSPAPTAVPQPWPWP